MKVFNDIHVCPKGFKKYQDDFLCWIEEGNACRVGDNKYREQTTQWKALFTLVELRAFFVSEFRS